MKFCKNRRTDFCSDKNIKVLINKNAIHEYKETLLGTHIQSITDNVYHMKDVIEHEFLLVILRQNCHYTYKRIVWVNQSIQFDKKFQIKISVEKIGLWFGEKGLVI